MFRRTAMLFLMGAFAIGFQGAVAEIASAHSLTITATESCSALISYTVTSFDQIDSTGSNSEIDILVNGSKVSSGVFTTTTTPENEFMGTFQLPAGTASATVEALAVALWGDGFASGESSTVGVSIPTDCPTASGIGRFTGGGKQVIVGGLTITKGLELDCDLHHSNNLEINWSDASGTHQFHLESFLFAACFLDEDFSAPPPATPINTMIGIGTGRFDGSDDNTYTVEFTLVDGGEPGRNDEAAFLIYLGAPPSPITSPCPYFASPGGTVLDFPAAFPTLVTTDPGTPCTAALANLTTGNLQAHVDQQ